MTPLTLAGPATVTGRATPAEAPSAEPPIGCVAAADDPAVTKSSAQAAPEDVLVLEGKVLEFARARLGRALGVSGCSNIADLALTASGARTFTDFGASASATNYVWGTSIDPKNAHPGDVIQFIDVAIERTTLTPIGRYSERFVAARQTAIVEENDAGAMVVLEQNIGGDPTLRRTRVYAAPGKYARDIDGLPDARSVTAVTVNGNVRAYRPEPR